MANNGNFYFMNTLDSHFAIYKATEKATKKCSTHWQGYCVSRIFRIFSIIVVIIKRSSELDILFYFRQCFHALMCVCLITQKLLIKSL